MEQPQPVCRKAITIDSPPLLAAEVSEGDKVLVTGLLAIMMLQLQEDSSPGVAPPSKHAVHQNNSQAMYCGVTFGPTFGGVSRIGPAVQAAPPLCTEPLAAALAEIELSSWLRLRVVRCYTRVVEDRGTRRSQLC